MFPVVIDLGTIGDTPIFLPTYGLLFALAVVTAWWWFMRRGRALGASEESLVNLVFYTILAGILGAKLLLVLVDWRVYLEDPWRLLGTLRSAGVLVGGVIGGALMFVAYCRRSGLPTWTLADALAAPLALAQAIGRVGCFGAGCCWGVGVHADHPLAVVFTDPRAMQHTGVPLHQPLLAVQLIQAAADLLLAGFLTWMWRRRPQPAGTVFWSYVLLYSVSRGTIEFWRGDVVRGLYFGGHVSTSQLFAIGGAVVAAAWLIRARTQQRAPAV